jgi:hypothetical protein
MTGAQPMEVPTCSCRRATRVEGGILGDHPPVEVFGRCNVGALFVIIMSSGIADPGANPTSPTVRTVVDRQPLSLSPRWVSAPTARPDLIADSDLDISGTGTKSCAGRARLGTSYLPADYERPSASSAFVLQSSGIESLFERTFLEILRRGAKRPVLSENRGMAHCNESTWLPHRPTLPLFTLTLVVGELPRSVDQCP